MCSQREIEFPLCSEMEEQRAQGDGEENLMPPPTAPPTPIIASLQFNPINDDQRMAALMIRLRENQTSTSSLEVNFKVGSREFGLSANDDTKISELGLKRKYS